jgi:hypothetical protein
LFELGRSPVVSRQEPGEIEMADLMRPLERVWEWIDRTGGYPGKVMVAGLFAMLLVTGITWYSNRR